MDKSFFEKLGEHERAYAARHSLDGAGSELVLVNTKVYGIVKIVEAADGWLHVDAEDIADDHKQVSLVLPYHQISHVRFREPRSKPGAAGFRLRA
jgi:hypothetical protein